MGSKVTAGTSGIIRETISQRQDLCVQVKKIIHKVQDKEEGDQIWQGSKGSELDGHYHTGRGVVARYLASAREEIEDHTTR